MPSSSRSYFTAAPSAARKSTAFTMRVKTPLIASVKADITLVVNILVLYAADTTIPDEDGNLPLHWTIKTGNAQIAKFFKIPEQAKAKMKKGQTPYYYPYAMGGRKYLKHYVASPPT